MQGPNQDCLNGPYSYKIELESNISLIQQCNCVGLLMVFSIGQQGLALVMLFALPTLFAMSDTDANLVSLLQASQYHFIPNGSYFQYSLNSFQLEDEQAALSTIKCTFNLTIEEPTAFYNLIIMPSTADNATELFNCYQRAVLQSISALMCPFPTNFTSPDQQCSTCIQNALNQIDQGNFEVIACLNCTQKKIQFNISSKYQKNQFQAMDQALLLIIDNSGLLFASQTAYLNLILDYTVQVQMSEGGEALLFLFCAVVGLLILLMIGAVIYLHLKIKKIGRLLVELKNKDE